IPGALPARRIRRLAPRPSLARGNAVNSYCMMKLLLSAAFRDRARGLPVVRHGDTLAPSWQCRGKLLIITRTVDTRQAAAVHSGAGEAARASRHCASGEAAE